MQTRRRLVSARARIDLCHGAKASDYINTWNTLQADDRVVLLCRVSTWQQEQGMNLRCQVDFMKRQLALVGAVPVSVLAFHDSGYHADWVGAAANLAYEFGASRVVAESVDRIVRSGMYDKYHQHYQAGKWNLDEVTLLAKGIPLVTYLHPDATPAEVRRHQRKRGQHLRGRVGGRPARKKTVRSKNLTLAQELRNTGMSWNEIASELSVPRTTVRRWALGDS